MLKEKIECSFTFDTFKIFFHQKKFAKNWLDISKNPKLYPHQRRFTLYTLRYPVAPKKVWRFRHIFVAFSEYMNFIYLFFFIFRPNCLEGCNFIKCECTKWSKTMFVIYVEKVLLQAVFYQPI